MCGLKSPPLAYSNGEQESLEKSLLLQSQLEMKVPETCKRLFQKECDEAKTISKAIDEEYNVHWIVDNLPVMTVLSGQSFDPTDVYYTHAYPLGFTEKDELGEVQHFLNIKYNEGLGEKQGKKKFEGSRIVAIGFIVDPYSVEHGFEGAYNEDTTLSACNEDELGEVQHFMNIKHNEGLGNEQGKKKFEGSQIVCFIVEPYSVEHHLEGTYKEDKPLSACIEVDTRRYLSSNYATSVIFTYGVACEKSESVCSYCNVYLHKPPQDRDELGEVQHFMNIKHNESLGNEQGKKKFEGSQIVCFIVEPYSVEHHLEGAYKEDTLTLSACIEVSHVMAETRRYLSSDNATGVIFTYGVACEKSKSVCSHCNGYLHKPPQDRIIFIMSITFGDQYNLLKLCPNFAPHENKDLLEAYGMMTELMRSIVEGVHPNALDEEIEGPSVKFQKFKAMVLKLMNTIFITIQVLALTLGVFLMLRHFKLILVVFISVY